MPQYKIITPEHFRHRYWQRYQGYAFAKNQAVVPLVISEVIRAATLFPIGFVHQDKYWQPAALMGQRNDTNLFIAPNGAWAGSSYIPAALRGYPFSLISGPNGQYLLCFDEDSGLVNETEDGEPFFDAVGQPSQGIRDVMNFLQQVEQHRRKTVTACEALETHGLLKPWTLEFKRPLGVSHLEGVYTIDEAQLKTLNGDALTHLRDAEALTLVYAQMLSSHLLPLLDRLADAHDRVVGQAAPAVDIDHLFGEGDGMVRFNFGD